MISKEAEGLKKMISSDIAPMFSADIDYLVQRKNFNTIGEQPVIPKDIKIEETSISGVPCMWVTGPETRKDRIIIHCHGGGYRLGSPKAYKSFAIYLARATSAKILLPDYRLVPENPYPAGIEDSTAVYENLLTQGFKPENIAFSGDSAGGGMVLAVLLNLRDRGTELPKAAVVMSPITDLTCTNETYKSRRASDPWLTPETMYVIAKQYIPDLDPKTPLASPFYADLDALPPILIHVGDCEILLDDSRRFAQKAKEEGVDVTLKVWEGLWHFFHFFTPSLPEANQALIEINDFLNAKMI